MASNTVTTTLEECGSTCLSPSPVSVQVIRNIKQIEALRAAWTSWRGHRDADIDVYQTILALRPDAAKPHVILIERDGRPDAILVGEESTTTLSKRVAYWTMPLSRVRVLSFVYGGFLGNQSEENAKLVIKEIERSLRQGEADVATLSYIREDTPLHAFGTRDRSLLMRDPFPVTQSHWMMDMPDTPDGIFAGISREHRRKLKAEAKKFATAFPDLNIGRFHGSERVDELLREAERVAATTYQRGLGVGFSDSRAIRELLRLEAKKGWLRGYVLYAGNRPCAFWIGCIYNGVFLSEYLGHDPSYAKYSSGTYLLMCATEYLWREGVSAIDFSIGEAFYKQRFGNRHWNESTIYLYAPTWAGMRVKALRTMAVMINSAGKALLKRGNLRGRLKKFWRQRVTSRMSAAAAE